MVCSVDFVTLTIYDDAVLAVHIEEELGLSYVREYPPAGALFAE